jgi:hypothetical protein
MREKTPSPDGDLQDEPQNGLSPTKFDQLYKIMSSYSDNAKTYNQVSMAALFLPIIFLRQVVATSEKEALHPPWPMVLSWILFLLSIGAGLLYQVSAAKYMERELDGWPKYTGFLHRLRETVDTEPGYIYDLMILCFYLASCNFVIGALRTRGVIGPRGTVCAVVATTSVVVITVVWWAGLWTDEAESGD